MKRRTFLETSIRADRRTGLPRAFSLPGARMVRAQARSGERSISSALELRRWN
jgi:hypothetical protein